MARWIVLLTLAIFVPPYWTSRVKITRNGYKNILIALPRDIQQQEDRARIVRNVEDIFAESSGRLLLATKGRAIFSKVTILVPYNWDIPDGDISWRYTSFNSSDFPEAGATWTQGDADVVITSHGQYPFVLHQAGCGRQGLRIYIPKDVLFGARKKFVRLWSEYRYGVFPEGGFRNDERFPITYKIPGEAEQKLTQCLNTTKWLPNVCSEGFIECNAEVMASSLMDQHQSSSTQLFCEGEVSLGPKHNPEPPSKHNLLCREEGAWFTVMRSPDFFRGKNAPPKRPLNPTVSFHYVRETVSPYVIVALEISSRMQDQSRYRLTEAAFSHFVANILPNDSKLTLIVFGGDEEPTVLVNEKLLNNEESKTRFLENQQLPEDVQDSANVSLHLLMDKIFHTIDNTENNRIVPPDIIIVTTVSYIPETEISKLRKKFLQTGSRLNILLFGESHEEETSWTSLYDLCSETQGQLIWLEPDPFGNLYRGVNVLHGPGKKILIMQDYLAEDDDIDLVIPFAVDESLTENLKVLLSFPYSRANPLKFRQTNLRTPTGELLTFIRKELLSAWVADVINPDVGEYVITTRRIEDATGPVLVTVTTGTSLSDDSITVKVWTETLVNSKITPPPVQIFAEIKNGWNPVRGAKVTAVVYHPNNVKSELLLLDDGLGNSDITKDDGIYGRYFTNFTSQGYYNVHIKVSQGSNIAEYLEEPNDFCCGSAFSAVSHRTGNFQREAGPETFYVAAQLENEGEDLYPPSRVTDLKLNATYDKLCIVQWTAAGDDYDSGFAKKYELKAFPNRALIRTRFSDSGQEIHSEVIETTPDVTYGVKLNHIFQFPETIQEGTYYLAVRAMDESGNTGEPSNAVPVWIAGTARQDKDCNNEESPENLEWSVAEKLQDHGNSARVIIPSILVHLCAVVNAVLLVIS